MNSTQLKDILRQGAKVAVSVGALGMVSKWASRIPGPMGKIVRGAVTVGTLVIPLLRKNRR